MHCSRGLNCPSQPALCRAATGGHLQLQQRSCSSSSSGTEPSSGSASGFTDINTDDWVQRWLPASAVPYAQLARWDRPIGTWLLLWPCLWSIALAAPPGALPDARLYALFGVGAFLMRGAGCTVNDLWDRDFDKKVERTRHRPLASGALHVPQALGFLGAQLSLALGVLLALPPPAVACGLLATPLWALYPLAKRFTDWPQLVLGFAINWGALLGWVGVHGDVHWPVVAPLYAGCVIWTLHYDTVYAHQDKRDDVRVGVRSTALRLGEHNALFLGGCCVGSVGCFGLAGAAAGLSPAFFAGLGGAAAHLGWQLRKLDLSDRSSCLRVFRSNRDFGMLLLLAIVAGKFFQEG